MPSIKHQLIDIAAVKAQVEFCQKQNFTWFYSQQTGSTNSDLLNHRKPLSIAISESQLQGRGQHDNSWVSSEADNLLFSIAINAKPNSNLALTPIQVGIALQKMLIKLGFKDIQLKWPNDIFYHKKKLGGILIESTTQDKHILMVIGVGLNVNMPYSHSDSFISLKENQTIDRTPLLVECINAILSNIENSALETVNAFNNAHIFHQQPIQFNVNDTIISGICQGINKQGQIEIKTQKGIEKYSTGSIVMVENAVS